MADRKIEYRGSTIVATDETPPRFYIDNSISGDKRHLSVLEAMDQVDEIFLMKDVKIHVENMFSARKSDRTIRLVSRVEPNDTLDSDDLNTTVIGIEQLATIIRERFKGQAYLSLKKPEKDLLCVKRYYHTTGTCDYCMLLLNHNENPESLLESNDIYTDEIVNLEEVIHTQYGGTVWFSTDPSR